MEITIQNGEGISQAIKRELIEKGQVNNKQFSNDIWKKIQGALQDGKSTLTNKQTGTKFIGDLWKPVTKNVRTRVNDVINIDDTTWGEILGFFNSSKAVSPIVKAEDKVSDTAPLPASAQLLVPDAATKSGPAPAPELETVPAPVSAHEDSAPAPIITSPVVEKPQEAELVSEADVDEAVLPEEVSEHKALDIETIKRNEKSAITVKSKVLKHDPTMLMLKATDLLVDVANMEDKPDVETGQEIHYNYKISSLSNNRAIEVRTYEDGHRSVHVSFDRTGDKTHYLFTFDNAEVVYDIGLDGKVTMRVMNGFGHEDNEEVDTVEIRQDGFNETMNGLIKKIFCE